jgi:hypothetical protein
MEARRRYRSHGSVWSSGDRTAATGLPHDCDQVWRMLVDLDRLDPEVLERLDP